MSQPPLRAGYEGEKSRDVGMQQSLDHANEKIESWGDKAFEFLLEYIKSHPNFMTEDMRKASNKTIPIPPSKRAWGPIIVRARREGLIRHTGYQAVKNKTAHRTPASVWRVINTPKSN